MRISLFQKLFSALLLSSAMVIVIMALQINASFKDGFQQYLNQEEIAKATLMSERASQYYSQSKDWTRFKYSPHWWEDFLMLSGEMPPPRDDMFPAGDRQPSLHGKPFKDPMMSPLSARLNLLDADGRVLFGHAENLNVKKGMHLHKVEIVFDGSVVGYISILQSDSFNNHLADQFLKSQTTNLMIMSFAAICVSLLFALVFVRYLLTPLRALHQGANAVRDGNLSYQVEYHSNDEIADVTQAFNHLVDSLKTQEEMRERWLSDISHELRTPLAVLRGELEALQDGIRRPEPAYIQSLHQQVLTLAQLVEDLRASAKADIKLHLKKESVNVKNGVDNVLVSHLNRFEKKSLSLEIDLNIDSDVYIHADRQKLSQVLNNLLENSYRYTDTGGKVKVYLGQEQNSVLLAIEDSSPGVPSDALPKLCERLFRVDQSRSRAYGGSGLGLSICKNIIQAHNGELKLEHSELGGLKVSVRLPTE